jgi:hypothetical protein
MIKREREIKAKEIRERQEIEKRNIISNMKDQERNDDLKMPQIDQRGVNSYSRDTNINQLKPDFKNRLNGNS